MVPTEQFDLTGIIALILLHWFYWDYWVGTLDFFVFFLSLWICLWLAETSQQPISQTTWLKVTPHCNHCSYCLHSFLSRTLDWFSFFFLSLWIIRGRPRPVSSRSVKQPGWRSPPIVTIVIIVTINERLWAKRFGMSPSKMQIPVWEILTKKYWLTWLRLYRPCLVIRTQTDCPAVPASKAEMIENTYYSRKSKQNEHRCTLRQTFRVMHPLKDVCKNYKFPLRTQSSRARPGWGSCYACLLTVHSGQSK